MKYAPAFSTMIFLACIGITFLQCNLSAGDSQKTAGQAGQYQCLPCGQDCDKANYNEPGKCAHCGMDLVKTSTVIFKNIQPSEICNYIRLHPDVVLLDVRTKEEFEGKANPDFGSLQHAINVPIQELESRLTSLSALKEKEIIVYCSHSHRSPQAAYILGKNGFRKVSNMEGGMSVMKDHSCMK